MSLSAKRACAKICTGGGGGGGGGDVHLVQGRKSRAAGRQSGLRALHAAFALAPLRHALTSLSAVGGRDGGREGRQDEMGGAGGRMTDWMRRQHAGKWQKSKFATLLCSVVR